MTDSRAAELVPRGRALWAWVQRSRPWRTVSRFTDVGGNVLAAGMSYQALFAVFAALWVGFSVFGIWLRSRPDLLDGLIEQINRAVPGLVGADGLVPLRTLLSAGFTDWTGAIAAISLLWVTVTWFTGTRRAIRIIFNLEVKQYRNAVLLKLRDLLLAIIFMAVLFVSAALTVASSNVTESLLAALGADPSNWLLGGIGQTLRYGVLYVFDVGVLLAIHRLLAEVNVPWWAMLRGCALGGLALFGLKVLGTLLLGGASSNPLLASFAVLIGMLIWFNLVCRTLLITASWIATGQDRALGLPEAAPAPTRG